MIPNKVKLLIWDLDETFWHGTLSEEGIQPINENVEIVRELTNRGIINSICSKNDAAPAREKLSELGVYEYFVFPKISFDPKGPAVSQIIEDAALRVENVLFIDDNRLNREEVQFFNPGIMTCHPADILRGLLAHPNLMGKPDPQHARLKQYRFLQQKVENRKSTTLSNEEFLRASNIRISIDADVKGNSERIVELINRSNQLNYTKLRLNTSEDITSFRKMLDSFGYQAGCIRVIDDFGDYGLVGFYLLQRDARAKELIHFVFSCRAMHMGIEQYVYEMLGQPDIAIAEPVSYGLNTHAKVDWINSANSNKTNALETGSKKLLLLGGCDLLQLASFCSAQRVEFVNKIQNDMKVRYDDPGFIMSDRSAIRDSESIRKIPLWTYEDALHFDESVSTSQLILISLWPAAKGHYFKTKNEVMVHFSNSLVKRLKKKHPDWLEHDVEPLPFDLSDRLRLIVRSLDIVADNCQSDCRIFLLGCYTLSKRDDDGRKDRLAYNSVCRDYCDKYEKLFRYVDVDAIVPPRLVASERAHFSREGYFLLAQHILNDAAL